MARSLVTARSAGSARPCIEEVAVAASDPACGMAQWGLALSLLGNPLVWPVGLTPQRLDEVVATLTTSANFNPTDKTYANQLKAAAILEPLFKAYPDHRGVAHYLIHSYDYPPIASQGLTAVKAYAAIAPDAAHALHMPAHIFTRVGYWKESIGANRESARVAGDATFDGHHASDYMVYAHLQFAQDEAARKAMQQSFALQPIDNFADALREYEAVMTKEPNRYRTLAGTMAAAQGAGEQSKALSLANALLKLGGEADSQRATLQQARQLAGGFKTSGWVPR